VHIHRAEIRTDEVRIVVVDAPEREVVVEHLSVGLRVSHGSSPPTNSLRVLGVRDTGTREKDGLRGLHGNSNGRVHVDLCVA
jgi:hypothetical protein